MYVREGGGGEERCIKQGWAQGKKEIIKSEVKISGWGKCNIFHFEKEKKTEFRQKPEVDHP